MTLILILAAAALYIGYALFVCRMLKEPEARR
jgi:hypothetical protein